MPESIRQRLLLSILALTFISWSIIAYINYSDARHEIGELFDAHLVQSAKVLLSLVDAELYEEKFSENHEKEEYLRLKDVEKHLFRHKYEKLLAFQITVSESDFYFSSAGAPEQPLSVNKDGFSDEKIDGKHWRVYTLHDPMNIITIRTAEPLALRAGLINEIAFNLLLPLIIGLPVLFLLIWKCLDVAFKPLDDIASDLRERNPLQLNPVTHNNIPAEIRPLVEAINRLLYQLDKALQNERRFTSDAAHELRTPLAGLKTQAQIAIRTHDAARREHALKNILKSVDRTAYLVDQLLNLARLEPGVEPKSMESCNLTQLVELVMDDMHHFASEKKISVEFHKSSTIHIQANIQAMKMLIRNLLDNAIRYTRPGGEVDVTLFLNDDGVLLQVCDSGPGISPENREDVFKRFFRANQVPETGSGLGLSIVKQIAELHGAVISLGESGKKGLKVDVFFPHKSPSGTKMSAG